MSGRRARQLVLALIVVSASTGIAGCAAESGADDARVDRVLEDFAGMTLSDFETAVLEDGAVSQSEYDEAFASWRNCAEGRGLTVTSERDEFGMYRLATTRPRDQATDDRLEQDRMISDECARGTLMVIDAVYRDQTLNPKSRDWNDGVVDCLREQGLVEADYTREKLLSGSPPLSEQALASACLENPFGVTGTQ